MFFRKLLRCSFCRKDYTEISKLVAGPRVYICDECASIVSRIIDGSYEPPSPPPSKSSKLLNGLRRALRYDGHTLRDVIVATERLTGREIERAFVDKG